MISKIVKMEDEAEKRTEKCEKRWQEAEEQHERECREHEHRQTQQMMNMFSNFMGHMSNILMVQCPMPTFSPMYAHAPYNSSMPSAVSYSGFMSDPSNSPR